MALYDDLDFTIPKGAKEEAQRGLDWRKELVVVVQVLV